MGYISTSTANPNGWRSFNAQLSQNVVPQHAFRLSGLGAYFPANYNVPTPMNITMRGAPNIYANGCPAGLGDLGDFINNIQWLRPGGWRSRDDDYSPLPRIYLPPEVANMSGLGADPGFDWTQIIRRRPRFSGGAAATNPADPRGFFFQRTPINPSQFPPKNAHQVWSPAPGDPSGIYFPRIPLPVLPGWLRARPVDWTAANVNSLSGLGVVTPVARRAPMQPIAVRPQPPVTIVTRGTPAKPSSGGGTLRPSPPVIIVHGPVSPSGRPIPTPQPVITPGTPPTYPPGVTGIGGGMCVVTGTPETGSDTSTVPCAGVPGYSPGTAPTTVYPPSVPAAPAAPWNFYLYNPAAKIVHDNTAYRAAQQAAAGAAAGLTPAQAAQAQAAGLTPAQYAAQLASGAAGGAAAAPAATDGTAATSNAADILGWLSESTLISGVPNWVPAAGGGLLVLWIMNRGKK